MVWIFFAILAVALLIIIAIKQDNRTMQYFNNYDGDDFDEEEVIVTEETVQENVPNITGLLKRQVEGSQFFVNDPADNEKIFVNASDDLYEDAQGRIWRLV